MLKGYFDIPAFNFFSQGNIWSASLYKTFNYKIIPDKEKKDDDTEVQVFKVYVWYGLKCYDKTEDFAAKYTFDFTEDTIDEIREKLTEDFEKYKEIRKSQ